MILPAFISGGKSQVHLKAGSKIKTKTHLLFNSCPIITASNPTAQGCLRQSTQIHKQLLAKNVNP